MIAKPKKPRYATTTFDAYRRSVGLRVNHRVAFACRFLEKHGYRFLVEFGTENAIDKAAALMCSVLEPPFPLHPDKRK